MENTPTKHNTAKFGEIAPSVIMTGDPMRAKSIAEKYLTDVKLVNSMRYELCYTGRFKGKLVSVMSSGMGNPSMGIYSYELFNYYGVNQIIRIGTCGTPNPKFKLGDIILSKKVLTDTNYDNYITHNEGKPLYASKHLTDKLTALAKEMGVVIKNGTTFNTDTFYENENELHKSCDNVEMESASLYINAKKAKKQAVAICVVTDVWDGRGKTNYEVSASAEARAEFIGKLVEVALIGSIE